MSIEKAVTIMKHYQSWRLGNINDMKYTPKEFTEALDKLIEEVELNINIG